MDKIKDNPIMLCAICALATFRNLDSKVLAIALSYELATTLVSFGIIPFIKFSGRQYALRTSSAHLYT